MTDSTPTSFRDEDLVYVDPEARTVVGIVEWSPSGQPKSRLCPEKPRGEDASQRGRSRKYFPWGTYRSMKRLYHLEGKRGKEQPTATLDETIEKALREPYWD